MSPLPSENDLIFLSRRAGPPAPRCHGGATSQVTERLGAGWGGPLAPLPIPAACCVSPKDGGRGGVAFGGEVAVTRGLPVGSPPSPLPPQGARGRLSRVMLRSQGGCELPPPPTFPFSPARAKRRSLVLPRGYVEFALQLPTGKISLADRGGNLLRFFSPLPSPDNCLGSALMET